MFRYLLHLKITFAHGVKKYSNLFFYMYLSIFHLLKSLSFLLYISLVYSCLLCHKLIDHKFVCLFLSSLFCPIDLCLFMCLCHAILITVALLYSLESQSVIPPALFFFLKIALAIWGLLGFHSSFRTICSSFVIKSLDILIGIALNL